MTCACYVRRRQRSYFWARRCARSEHVFVPIDPDHVYGLIMCMSAFSHLPVHVGHTARAWDRCVCVFADVTAFLNRSARCSYLAHSAKWKGIYTAKISTPPTPRTGHGRRLLPLPIFSPPCAKARRLHQGPLTCRACCCASCRGRATRRDSPAAAIDPV